MEERKLTVRKGKGRRGEESIRNKRRGYKEINWKKAEKKRKGEEMIRKGKTCTGKERERKDEARIRKEYQMR